MNKMQYLAILILLSNKKLRTNVRLGFGLIMLRHAWFGISLV